MLNTARRYITFQLLGRRIRHSSFTMSTDSSTPTAATNTTKEPSSEIKKKKYPAVTMYGPCTVRDLKEGELKKWCTCGLTKKSPWCDGSHKGTGFKSLKWTVPTTQGIYQICSCKYTKSPPICDGTHCNLPLEVLERQKSCTEKDVHTPDCKLCTGCGWVPDF